MATDLLGRQLTTDEAELLDLYRRLQDYRTRDLAPSVRANVDAALVGLWNAWNNLGLISEPLVADPR
jgi:hypothetical protein